MPGVLRVSKRTVTECAACNGGGKRITGYSASGQPFYSGKCPRCDGVGLVPMLAGREISWRTAFGIMDREEAEKTGDAALPVEQKAML